MKKLVLIRHGQSVWNRENKFTGWTDVDLSEQGIREAHEAARVLKEEGYTFDLAYTSYLKRAIRTLWIVLDELDLMWIPVVRSWKLNERHYGALQGLNKADTAAKYGEEQVHIWRRSYDITPPPLEDDDPRNLKFDPKYADVLQEADRRTESLKITLERVLPYWHETIAPSIQAGKKVVISAHGNSLRALVKHLDHLSEKEVLELNIPTGIPLVYEFDDQLNPGRHYYLGDAEAVQTATAAVAAQGKAKG